MEVREISAAYKVSMGFKQTEIGLLPNDWMTIPLAAEFEVQLGKMLDAAKNSGDDKPFIGNRAVQWGRIEVSNIGLIKLQSSELSRFRLKKGDLMVCEGGEVGRCAIWDEQLSECYFQKALHRLRPKNGYNVNFLANVLRLYSSKGFLASYVTQTSIAHLPKDKFQSLPIPLPPTQREQDAIAEALSDADALIESLSLLLTKKLQIKQGAMQELLTGKKRLPGFSGKWKAKVLGKCASLKARIGWQGLTTKEYLDSGDYYLVTGTELHGGEINWDECSHVDATRYKQDVNIQLQIDDVLVTKDGTIGKVGIVTKMPKPATLNSGVFVIRPVAGEFHSKFFYYLLCSSVFTNFLEQLAAGSTINHLYQKDFVKFVFHRPPTEDEQQEIANVLTDMDVDISEARLKLTKAHQLKQAMMQELLTGRIRLLQAPSNVIPLPIKPTVANPPSSESAHNWQINEAVVIGVLAQRFGNEKFPLPRKRRVKLMYLLHRHAEGRAEGYLKKAAGPYDPNTKYKGPEAIALKNRYVRALRNDKYEGFVAGDKIEQAQRYFEQWYGTAALEWLEQFHYRKTDDLELLATVDMAMVDMATLGKPVDVAGIKRVIAGHPEWVPKLSRALFSDEHIASAITECQTLFNG